MQNTHLNQAILLIHCPDQKGLVTRVTEFLWKHEGNIVDLDEHVDTEEGIFFLRVQWELDHFDIEPDQIGDVFSRELARKYDMTWHLYFRGQKPRMALFVSKSTHCLFDILARQQSKEWLFEIGAIISNHRSSEKIANQFNLPFHFFDINGDNKREEEHKQLQLLQSLEIDFIVLARYMQILSEGFIEKYPNKIINIHHSFLPAFPGARPYHQAYDRGVKIIGATSHYVTKDLDAGPIIEQDVVKISHKDSVQDLVRKGQDLEKIVLSRAVWAHINRKVLSYGNKTILFD